MLDRGCNTIKEYLQQIDEYLNVFVPWKIFEAMDMIASNKT
jgi:hypothetical protein